MSKPRMFIGSSVEGLQIAYALQMNLQREVEVTVWPQGVFKPSASTLDSLMAALSTQDFGTFIFTPDDLLVKRETAVQVARDNVILELGLYVGHLGRNRSFFVVPDTGTLGLPSDLLGITPVRYETGRSDGNWQAATGAAAFEILPAVRATGPKLRTTSAPAEGSQSTAVVEQSLQDKVLVPQETTTKEPFQSADHQVQYDKFVWFEAFHEGKHAEAIAQIDQQLTLAPPEDIVALKSFRAWASYRADAVRGEKDFRQLIQEYPADPEPIDYFVFALVRSGRASEALSISSEAIKALPDRLSVIDAHVLVLNTLGREDEALAVLLAAIERLPGEADLYLSISKLQIKRKEYERARFWLDRGMQLAGDSIALLKAYANFLNEHVSPKAALVPYTEWVGLERDPESLTMRANAYLALDLSSVALRDYREADELAKGSQAWIVANIGNLLNAVGLHHEAIKYLKKALELAPDSEYAHDRLASAMKAKNEQIEQLTTALEEARAELQQWRTANPVDPKKA